MYYEESVAVCNNSEPFVRNEKMTGERKINELGIG